MAQWVTQPTLQIDGEFRDAYVKASHRNRTSLYRSRSDVTPDMINTAFTWTHLPKITNVDEPLVYPEFNRLTYITNSIKRGITPVEAKREVLEKITFKINDCCRRTIMVFNTSTAAAASDAVKQELDTNDLYTELDYRTLVTSTPTHKIHIYKVNDAAYPMYIILNNVDTPSVLFKIATALMLEEKPFEDKTDEIAGQWLNGDADQILRAVNNYYSAYNKAAKDREYTKVLNELATAGDTGIKRKYEQEIHEVQLSIDNRYKLIREDIARLNQLKAEYLLKMTVNEQDKLNDLKQYLTDCKDKIARITLEDDNLIIIYNTQIMYYEESLLTPYFESTRENVVNNASPAIQQLLKDIFINHTVTLLIQSGISINLNNKSFRYVPPGYYVDAANAIGIPNPHHLYFNCWGDNQPIIHRALLDADYLTAICTAFAAMSGISLSDTAVMEKFIRDELAYTHKNTNCIKINETGEVITIAEYERRFNDASNETNEQTDTGSDNGHEETAEAV